MSSSPDRRRGTFFSLFGPFVGIVGGHMYPFAGKNVATSDAGTIAGNCRPRSQKKK
ncbi:unnamed protein product [Amoebophrya sp. A25]|nr:unnamed protein product [Amoebophrya sp. A25]|eukprot:GSA25T00027668001.1